MSPISGQNRMCGEPVSRILFPGSLRFDDHSSGPRIASRPPAANPDPFGKAPMPEGAGSLFALTPPFHPDPRPLQSNVAKAVCSLWRCPSGYPARALPGTVALWSPDFPPARVSPRRRPSGPPHKGRSMRQREPRQRKWLDQKRGQCLGRNYLEVEVDQAGKRWARSAASPASVASRGPCAPGRNRRRKAASSVSSSTEDV